MDPIPETSTSEAGRFASGFNPQIELLIAQKQSIESIKELTEVTRQHLFDPSELLSAQQASIEGIAALTQETRRLAEGIAVEAEAVSRLGTSRDRETYAPVASVARSKLLAEVEGEDTRERILSPETYNEGRRGLSGLREDVVSRLKQEINDIDFGGETYEQVRFLESEGRGAIPVIGSGSDVRPVLTDQEFTPEDVARFNEQGAFIRADGEYEGVIFDRATAVAGQNRLAQAARVRGALTTLGNAKAQIGRTAGAVGLAAAAYDQVGSGIASQRQAGLEAQRALGTGSFSADTLGSRLESRVFQYDPLTRFSGLDKREAEALFDGTLDIFGADSEMRQQANQEGLELYRELGVSVQESLALFRQARASGMTSLGEIANSLEDVTDAANEAEISASRARESFSRAFQQYSSVFGGDAGLQLAEAQTEAITALGIEGVEGIQSDSLFQIIAGRLGVSEAELQADVASGEIEDFARERDRLVNAYVRRRVSPHASVLRAVRRKYDLDQITAQDDDALAEAAADLQRAIGFPNDFIARELALPSNGGLRVPQARAYQFLVVAFESDFDSASRVEAPGEERGDGFFDTLLNTVADNPITTQPFVPGLGGVLDMVRPDSGDTFSAAGFVQGLGDQVTESDSVTRKAAAETAGYAPPVIGDAVSGVATKLTLEMDSDVAAILRATLSNNNVVQPFPGSALTRVTGMVRGD